MIELYEPRIMNIIKTNFKPLTNLNLDRNQLVEPDRSANQRPLFLAGNHLKSCPDSDLRKNLKKTLGKYLPIW